MKRESVNEMEQIQKGLEEFLAQEIAGYKDANPPEREADIIEPNGKQAQSPAMESMTGDAAQTPEHDERLKSGGQVSKQHIQEEKHTQEHKNTKNKKAKHKDTNGKRAAGKPPKRKSKFKKFLLFLLLAALLLGGIWYYAVGSIYKKMGFQDIPNLSGEPMKAEGVINILLIGNDSRAQGEDGRSDAMILLSISNKTKTIHMTSLLRDMYVDIPGHKGNRLNAAYAYGGAELLLETVEENLGIEVNRYALVNFQAFANLVDAVGGIELELTNEEVQWVNAYLNEYNMLEGKPIDTDYLDTSLSGLIHLNGPQALAYSRNRYIGTDFGRTERQRKILSAVIKKMPLTVVTNPKELVNGLFPNLTTNLTQNECLRLSLTAGKLLTYEIIQGSIPVEGSFKNASIRGMSVLEVDFEKNKEYIRTNIYGETGYNGQ